MPELPDIEAYLHALRPRVVGRPLQRLTLVNPFILRSVDPPIDAAEGASVTALRRLGKRIVFELAHPAIPDPLFLIIHLMIAGRLQWKDPGAAPPGRITQAFFTFPAGRLVLTEAGTKRRASLHLVRGNAALSDHDPGGLELLAPAATPGRFAAALRRDNRMLKRALTDPHIISGIGNAFSDEILHAARLSPILLTSKLTGDQPAALLDAARKVLINWTRELSARFGRKFPGPGDVTAFRPEFAAHGKFGRPCPLCGTLIQRILHAENETNYCPRCQTGGKLLADRSLSRLLKEHWPRTIDELER